MEPARIRSIVESVLLSDDARREMSMRAERMGRPQVRAANRMAAHLAESLGEALQEPIWTEELGG